MRQNLIVALLSVIATLLLVLVAQNMSSTPILAQTGGGAGATVGTIGVATGTLQGSDAAGFWIYSPEANKILIYDWGSSQLRLRAVRDISYDMRAPEFNLKGQKGPTVLEMKRAVSRVKSSKSSKRRK